MKYYIKNLLLIAVMLSFTSSLLAVVMTVEFNDSNGDPIQNGYVKYYDSGWQEFGITNVSGEAIKNLAPGVYKFRMIWAGNHQDILGVNIQNTNPLVFTTLNMQVKLITSEGAPLANGMVQYDAGGYELFGYTNDEGLAALELLPGIYHFRMKWQGKRVSKSNIDIALTNPLIFQTVQMNVHLSDSNGNGLEGGLVFHRVYPWIPFGTTDAEGNCQKELLPGVYNFRMEWFGKNQDIPNIDIELTNPLAFQTIKTIVKLLDSEGGGVGDGVVKLYDYDDGWVNFGTTSGGGGCGSSGGGTGGGTNMELLPGTYSFSMTYQSATQKAYNVNIENNNPYVFQMIKMLVKLKDSQGNGLNGGEIEFRSSGWTWYTFGTTSNPGGGSSGGGGGCSGHTSTSSGGGCSGGGGSGGSGGCGGSGGSGGSGGGGCNGGSGGSGGGGCNGGGSGGGCSGGGCGGGGNGGSGGMAHMDLLPGTYKFRINYLDKTNYYHDVNINETNPLVIETVNMVVKLVDSDQSGLLGGFVQFNSGQWNDFGLTDENGEANLEILTGVYSFKIYYNDDVFGYSFLDIEYNNPVVFEWDGSSLKSAPIIQEEEKDIVLDKIFPNPFSQSLNIHYSVYSESNVNVIIYDMKGQIVSTLLSEKLSPGNYEIRWSGTNNKNEIVNKGAYFCRIVSGQTSITKSVIKTE